MGTGRHMPPPKNARKHAKPPQTKPTTTRTSQRKNCASVLCVRSRMFPHAHRRGRHAAAPLHLIERVGLENTKVVENGKLSTGVAQLVERRAFNLKVQGSKPCIGDTLVSLFHSRGFLFEVGWVVE